jgi:predicted deacylase
VIAGERVRLGETRDLLLRFSESYLGAPVSVPVRVVRAKRQGPRVFLTGAIHGDELNGMGIIRQLLYGETPQLQCGTLVCLPVVNVYGLEHHTRYLPDRRDLNRCFPGIPSGSLSSRLAHTVFEEVVRQCDFGIDFHTAGVRHTNFPNVRADMRDPALKRIARAFGCELIVNSRGPQGSLRREAQKAGVPTLLLEAGEVWKVEPSAVDVGMNGALNVLRHLGMLPGKPAAPLFQVTVDKTTWLRAEHGGVLTFHARPGDFVLEGDHLATNFNIFGREQRQIRAPVSGIILGMATMPAVKPGGPIYHIATLSRGTVARLRSKVEASPDRARYVAIQRALATNVHVVAPGGGA